MKISSVNEDVIWHKWRKFYGFLTAHKNGTSLVSKDVMSKYTRRCVFFIGQNPVYKYKKKQLSTSLPSTSLTITWQLRHSVL